jgi:hypothetical protein
MEETAMHLVKRLPDVQQPVLGQYLVSISPGASVAMALAFFKSSGKLEVAPRFLVFLSEVQHVIDSTLGRLPHPQVATLSLRLSQAISLWSPSSTVPVVEDRWEVRTELVPRVASVMADLFINVGLPACTPTASVEGVLALYRNNKNGLSEFAMPVDYVTSAVLYLAGEQQELRQYVERRLRELGEFTDDAELEPFLGFGPALLNKCLH